MGIEERKQEHLTICSNENVQSRHTHYWDEIHIPPVMLEITKGALNSMFKK
jgi:hypothetical protein